MTKDVEGIPYGIAILLFKYHVINSLCKELKLSPKEGLERWEAARKQFDETVHELMVTEHKRSRETLDALINRKSTNARTI